MSAPRSRTALTRALLAAIAALERSGHPVQAVHVAPDGGMTVLTEAPAGALPANDAGDWVMLAGQKTISRAQGA